MAVSLLGWACEGSLLVINLNSNSIVALISIQYSHHHVVVRVEDTNYNSVGKWVYNISIITLKRFEWLGTILWQANTGHRFSWQNPDSLTSSIYTTLHTILLWRCLYSCQNVRIKSFCQENVRLVLACQSQLDIQWSVIFNSLWIWKLSVLFWSEGWIWIANVVASQVKMVQ